MARPGGCRPHLRPLRHHLPAPRESVQADLTELPKDRWLRPRRFVGRYAKGRCLL